MNNQDSKQEAKPTIQSLRIRNAAIKRQIREATRERSRMYLEEEHLRLQQELENLTNNFKPNYDRYK